MTIQPLLGAALVAGALPTAFAGAGGRREPKAVVVQNLHRNLAPTPDLRTTILAESSSERLVAPAVGALARRARRLTPAGMLDKLEARIVAAGIQATWPLERVLAAKLVLSIVGATLGIVNFASSPS